jgi:RNA polymerase sigma factor for flagellar operon FliA
MTLDNPARTLDHIWREYAREQDLIHRNELIVAYQPLVTKALRRLPSHVRSYWGNDELRSFGQDGLVKAIERWDGVGAKFEAYALKRIRGAIFDEFRRLDWVPRTIRERINTYRLTHDRLTHDLKRNPSHGEVCTAMGLDDRQGAELLVELRGSQFLHLSATVDGETSNETLADSLHAEDDEPEAQVIGEVLTADLEKAVSSLLPREQAIIHLAFVAGLSQEQIGDIIGVSGSQICKIQGRALNKLRTVLSPVYFEQEPPAFEQETLAATA